MKIETRLDGTFNGERVGKDITSILIERMNAERPIIKLYASLKQPTRMDIIKVKLYVNDYL